jgi:drug/metabolite transporter (DMT)-like permease
VTNTAFALFCTGIPMGAYAFTTDFIDRTETADGAVFSLFCIILLGIFGTALSTVMFNKLIKVSGALAASSVTYLIPIVAVVWGLWDHESLGLFHMIGLVSILCGVYLVNRQGKSIQVK